MNTQLLIKTDKQLKEDAKKIAKKIGVPLSTVINAFLRQFVRDEEVTFSGKEYQITPYLEEIVLEARKDRKNNSQNFFSSADDFIKDLES